MEAADILTTLHHITNYLSEVYTELSGQNAALHVIIGHLRKSLDYLAGRSARQEADPSSTPPPTTSLPRPSPSTSRTKPSYAAAPSATGGKKITTVASKVVPSAISPMPSPPPLQMPVKYIRSVKQYEEVCKAAWQSIPSLSALASLPSPSLFELQSNLHGSVSDASSEYARILETAYRSNNPRNEAQKLFCAVVAAQRWILDALKLISAPPGSPAVSLSSSLGVSAEGLHQLLFDLKGSREKLSRLTSDRQVMEGGAEDQGSTKEEEEIAFKWRDRFLRSMSSKSAPTNSKGRREAPKSASTTNTRLREKSVGRPLGCWLADSSWTPISDPASQAPWLPLYPSSLASSGYPIKIQCSLSQAISRLRAVHHLQLGLLQLHLEGSIAISLIPSVDIEAEEEDEVRRERRIAQCRLAHLFLVKSAWHKGMRVAEEVEMEMQI